MNLKTMRYIIEIADAGNISMAGRKLGVSQPTLSTFLTNLENQLGMDLFIREKKRLTLTPAGKIYTDAARKILQTEEQTRQTIYRLTHQTTDTITIGATPLRGSIAVAQIFPLFSKRFPHVKIQIQEAYTEELQRLVRTGAVNYALGSCYDTEIPDLDYIITSKEEVVLGVPAFHRLAPLAAGSSSDNLVTIDIRQFSDSPFVMMSRGTTVRTISDNILSKAGLIPTIVFETNNNLVLSYMIRHGAGIGFLPCSAMAPNAEDVVYFSLQPRYYLNLGAVFAKKRILSEAERYFVYLLIRQDMENPRYIPAHNGYARNILSEFSMEKNYYEK